MLKHYFHAALANVLNHKLFSVINILGLSVGLAASFLILLYVQHETSYDKHWPDAERIYRLNTTFNLPGREPYRLSTTSSLLLPAMENYFPDEIETGARAWFMDVTDKTGNEPLSAVVVAVDQAFPEIFPLDVLQGSLSGTLDNFTGIALSEEAAIRRFGSTDVLGETVTIVYAAGDTDYRVTAIYRSPKEHTVVELPALIRFDETRDENVLNTWNQVPTASFLKIASGYSVSDVSGRLDDFTDHAADISAMSPGPDTLPHDRLIYDMENIRDIYLDPAFEDFTSGGSRTTVQAFGLIAVLVVLIASINFTVLSMARSARRAPDIAIRKMVGATRIQLLVQYLAESFLIVSFAMIVGLMLVELALPLLESFLSISLDVDYTAPGTYVNIVTLLILVGFTGGIYPALILSDFKPLQVFNLSRTPEKNHTFSLRNTLVIFQFGIAIALIVATCVIYLQVQFVSQRDPGFNKDNLFIIHDLFYRAEVAKRKETLRDQVGKLPNVINVTLSGYHPMATTPFARMSSSYLVEGVPDKSFILANTFIDTHYFDTYDMKIVAGRNFSPDRDGAENTDNRPVVINETAVRYLGFPSPEAALGRVLYYPNGDVSYAIIGVVADSQYYSLRAEPRPELSVIAPDFSNVLAVRYRGDPQEMVVELESVWRTVMGEEEFIGGFLEPFISQEFSQEKKEAAMLFTFSLLAILIACLGLYGSAAYTVDHRTKEIGIRKVMGAEVREIVSLLMWQFSKPVLIANVIAWPAALWAMLNWLQRFPYQIDTLLLIPLCVLAGFIALSIAWLTVAGNTVKVATTNPVYALRYE